MVGAILSCVTVIIDHVARVPIPSSATGVRLIVRLFKIGDITTLYDHDESICPVPNSIDPE